MIAREWRCLCPAAKIEEFISYLHKTGIKDAGKNTGFIGAEILQRKTDSSIEVVLITFWDSIESISGFAGNNIDQAVLYPEDHKYEITPDHTVKHYTVKDRF